MEDASRALKNYSHDSQYKELHDEIAHHFVNLLEKHSEMNTARMNATPVFVEERSSSQKKIFEGFVCLLCSVNPMKMEIMHNLIEASISPDTITCNTLINGLYKVCREDEALRLVAGMENSYTVIDGLCKVERVDNALGLVAKMLQEGYILNIYTYSSLIDGFYKAGKIDKDCNLFVKMKEFGPIPDEVTYI
ncbi:pentatricopeptide repeat-containing protein At1g62680, mitochondrial-like [Cryptomeria japonica]|uniref:pentatricopeptide repeat-containing protein At1g62680, mitochondrial-like n=1 Tax=Cryptomeria japonica TaxID=3369 RepID=UPI0027DA9B63|nr:pentatricopeptide repeat-containing protein At1g62680, mitochondrial-like [Cryptomeria japonica]